MATEYRVAIGGAVREAPEGAAWTETSAMEYLRRELYHAAQGTTGTLESRASEGPWTLRRAYSADGDGRVTRMGQ